MHRSSKAQEFRGHAEDCRLQAERCSTELEKEQWGKMGEEWLRMARTPRPGVNKMRDHDGHLRGKFLGVAPTYLRKPSDAWGKFGDLRPAHD